jgi:hypothetical protein
MSARLPVFLKGRALLIFDQIPQEEMTSWGSISESFTDLFHTPEERLLRMRKFFARVSRREEPLEQLADDLKRYLQFAMSNTQLQQQDVLLNFQLLRSLPRDLAEKLEIHQHIMSFGELMKKARLSLLERKSSSPSIAVVQPIPKGKQADISLADKVVELKADVNRIRIEQRKYFKCGRQGYQARDCRRGPTREADTRRRTPAPAQETVWASDGDGEKPCCCPTSSFTLSLA